VRAHHIIIPVGICDALTIQFKPFAFMLIGNKSDQMSGYKTSITNDHELRALKVVID